MACLFTCFFKDSFLQGLVSSRTKVSGSVGKADNYDVKYDSFKDINITFKQKQTTWELNIPVPAF